MNALLACGALGALVLCGCSSQERAATPVGDTVAVASPEVAREDSQPALDGGLDPAFFDPGGYYSPVDSIKVDGRTISGIGARTAEYYYDGALHYDRPRLIVPHQARLLLTDASSEDRAFHACAEAVVSADTVAVRCLGTPIGDVSIEGQLLDKDGAFFNKLEYENTPTVLLEARVVIVKNGVTVYDRTHQFTYWAGD